MIRTIFAGAMAPLALSGCTETAAGQEKSDGELSAVDQAQIASLEDRVEQLEATVAEHEQFETQISELENEKDQLVADLSSNSSRIDDVEGDVESIRAQVGY